jgi:hypothetical protein
MHSALVSAQVRDFLAGGHPRCVLPAARQTACRYVREHDQTPLHLYQIAMRSTSSSVISSFVRS